jgi:hypothetical protein
MKTIDTLKITITLIQRAKIARLDVELVNLFDLIDNDSNKVVREDIPNGKRITATLHNVRVLGSTLDIHYAFSDWGNFTLKVEDGSKLLTDPVIEGQVSGEIVSKTIHL